MLSAKLINRLSLHDSGGGVPTSQLSGDAVGNLGFSSGARYVAAPMPISNPATREWAAGILDQVSPGHWFRSNVYHVWEITTEADAMRLVQHLNGIVKDRPTGFDFETRDWSPRAKLVGLLGGAKVHKGLSPVHPKWRALPVTFQISWGQASYVVAGHLLYLFAEWLTQISRLDGANMAFETHVCRNVGIGLHRFYRDALQMHYQLDELEHQRYPDLKSVTEIYLGLDPVSFSDTFHEKDGETYESVLKTDALRALKYAALDPLISTWLAEVMDYLLAQRPARPGYNSSELYHLWERPFQTSIIRMEEAGVPTNEDAAIVHHELLVEQIEELDARAYQLVGRVINLSSPAELCRYYYDEKHYPVVLTNEGHFCILCNKAITSRTNHTCPTHGRGALINTPSLDDAVLERFVLKKDPLAGIIQERRTIDKARSTWVDGYYKYASGYPLGFPSINGAHVVSGRLAAGVWLTTPEYLRSILSLPLGPNDLVECVFSGLTIPKGVDGGQVKQRIQRVVKAKKLGCSEAQRRALICKHLGIEDQPLKLIGADYSQLELRILTQVTSDVMMADAFLKKRDLHAWTGALLEAFRRKGVEAISDMAFCEALYEEITAAHKKSELSGVILSEYERKLIKVRKGAKSVNFGMVYGMGADKLAAELGCSLHEAQQIFEVIWAMYHMTKSYYDNSIKEVTKTGALKTLLGRNQLIPELLSKDEYTRGYGERLVKNKPCQAGAADIIRGAMIQVDIDLEAGGAYGRFGRGAYGLWVYSNAGDPASKTHWVPDYSVLPKGWGQAGLPEPLLNGLGSLGQWGFRQVLQCHDELVLLGPAKHADQARMRLQQIMEVPFGADLTMTIPLSVKTGEGVAWSALK